MPFISLKFGVSYFFWKLQGLTIFIKEYFNRMLHCTVLVGLEPGAARAT
jgi:hypothetical protein